jgi:hypothetical protein
MMGIDRVRRAGLLLALLTVPACSGNGLGALGDILGSAMPSANQQQTGQLAVEVRQVDTQNRRIQVTTQDGQTGWVFYDENTIVVYQQQQYGVQALERGDHATMQVQQDGQGNVYTRRIDVTQSVQERTGQSSSAGHAQLMQIAGRVGQIDHDRGVFLLQMQNGTVTVTLPYNAPRATVDYFHRLRTGHNVRLEAIPTGSGRAEIYRFL